MGYNINHGASIPSPILSSKIINAIPENGDVHLFQWMVLWTEHPYNYDDLEEEDAESNNSSSYCEDDKEESNNSSSDQVPPHLTTMQILN